MRSPRDILAAILFITQISQIGSRMNRSRITVLGYHRIREDSGSESTDFDDGVLGPTAAQFRRQLQWLKKRVRILSEDSLLRLIHDGDEDPRPSALVTFDDAYKDNHSLALPVLEELRIPAMFFVPTRMVEERYLGWWDLIAYFLKRTAVPSFRFGGRTFDTTTRRQNAIDYFQELMKSAPAATTAGLMSELAELCEVPFPSPPAQSSLLMTWDDVRDAVDRGVSVGSHSHSHRVLTTLDTNAVREELELSKSVLEAQTGKRVRSIAFPVGGDRHFNGEIQRLASKCGYDLCFSFNTGTNHRPELNPLNIKRLGASSYLPRFAALTAFPRFFAWRP